MGNAKSKRKKEQVEAEDGAPVENGAEDSRPPSSQEKVKSKKKKESKKKKKKDKDKKNKDKDDTKLEAPTIVISPPSDVEEVLDSLKEKGITVDDTTTTAPTPVEEEDVGAVKDDEPEVLASNGEVKHEKEEDEKKVEDELDDLDESFMEGLPTHGDPDESLMTEILQKLTPSESVDNLSDSAIDIDSPRSVEESATTVSPSNNDDSVASSNSEKLDSTTTSVAEVESLEVKPTPVVDVVEVNIVIPDTETPLKEKEPSQAVPSLMDEVSNEEPPKETSSSAEESVAITPAPQSVESHAVTPDLVKDTPDSESRVGPTSGVTVEELVTETSPEPSQVTESVTEQLPVAPDDVSTDTVSSPSVIVVTASPDMTSSPELDVVSEEPSKTEAVVTNGNHQVGAAEVIGWITTFIFVYCFISSNHNRLRLVLLCDFSSTVNISMLS